MSTPNPNSEPSPPYIPTVYDETYRAKHYMEPSIMSIANRATLLGYLDHHAPTTDGSFSICVASGEGVFVSQALFESIPEEHRPSLDTTLAGQSVSYMMGNAMTAIGTTMMPLLLTDAETSRKFRIIVHALVLPNLRMGMFISQFGDSSFVTGLSMGPGGTEYKLDFGEGGIKKVKGL